MMGYRSEARPGRTVAALAAIALVTGCLSTPRPPDQAGDGGTIGRDGGIVGGDGGFARDGGACAGRQYTQVAAGTQFACGLDKGGGVWCWGIGDNGRLGDGSTRDHGKPVQVMLPVSAQALQISAGLDHACAVDGHHQVWCWGDNSKGESGGSQETNPTPVQIMNGGAPLTGIAQVAAGNETTCAVSDAGEVWCWGDNNSHQAGAASGDEVDSPQKVQALANAVGVTVGDGVSCAWTSAGNAYCWGDHDDGKLGPAASADSATPVEITGINGTVTRLAAWDYICAVTKAGAVSCWGNDDKGQLGQDVGSSSAMPVTVPSVSGAVDVAAGVEHACAATSSGKLWCWGKNHDGEVGPAQIGRVAGPTQVTTGAVVTQVSAGARDSCFVTKAGGLACFGSNGSGQLGLGDAIVEPSPRKVNLGGIQPAAVVAGGDHTCVVDQAGNMWCFGANDFGQLGDGTKVSSSAPVEVGGFGNIAATKIAAGASHTCAFGVASGDSSPWLLCWGKNNHNQLGDGSGGTQTTPVKVNLNAGMTAAVAAGSDHSVALLANQVFEWGDGISGVAQVGGTPLAALQRVAAGTDFGCAATGGGALCWGAGNQGQLGDGSTQDHPSSMVGVNLGLFTSVSGLTAGGEHACAIARSIGTASTLFCWGDNAAGDLGNGGTSESSTPVKVDSALPVPVAAVDAGGENTCAIDSHASLYCWGANNLGQLGVGSAAAATATPAIVTGISAGVKHVSVGRDHTCAIDGAGALWCWGSDRDGQLGSGRKLDFTAPVAPLGACL